MIARLRRALAGETSGHADIFGSGVKLRSAVGRRADGTEADDCT